VEGAEVNEVLDKKLIEKIKKIRLLILDVDGVMTDGKIIMDNMGNELKNFHVRDGHGIKLLMRYDIDVIILTGRKSKVVERRAYDLGIKEVHQGIFNKLEISEEILAKRSLDYDHIAYVGDDIVDVPLLRRAGFSVAVADAAQDVKKCVDYVTKQKGGYGAVREICEIILRGQNKWGDLAKKYELL
jgi:3-deoxy-D-manno-octulosonate 8-phosphate phosphatase (KDO 8-P phosphatase)